MSVEERRVRDRAQALAKVYSELHQNIQDVFNDYGVAIMTPAYESDPASPKVVPQTEWHRAPAAPPRGAADRV